MPRADKNTLNCYVVDVSVRVVGARSGGVCSLGPHCGTRVVFGRLCVIIVCTVVPSGFIFRLVTFAVMQRSLAERCPNVRCFSVAVSCIFLMLVCVQHSCRDLATHVFRHRLHHHDARLGTLSIVLQMNESIAISCP